MGDEDNVKEQVLTPNRENEEFKDDDVYVRPEDAPVLENMSHEEIKAYCLALEKRNKEVVDMHNKLVDEAEETISERLKLFRELSAISEKRRLDLDDCVNRNRALTHERNLLEKRVVAARRLINSLSYTVERFSVSLDVESDCGTPATYSGNVEY